MNELESVLLWVLFEILLFNISVLPILLFFLLKRYNRNVFFIQKDNFVFYWLILTGFCVFDKSSGDYFHYLDIVQDLSQSRFLESHLEDFYIELFSR